MSTSATRLPMTTPAPWRIPIIKERLGLAVRSLISLSSASICSRCLRPSRSILFALCVSMLGVYLLFCFKERDQRRGAPGLHTACSSTALGMGIFFKSAREAKEFDRCFKMDVRVEQRFAHTLGVIGIAKFIQTL